MGVMTRSHAKQEADKAASASSSDGSAQGKGEASSREARPVKPRNKISAEPPAAPKDDQAGIVFPTDGAGLTNIAVILEGAGARYKANWMATPDGTKYINCIWFDLVTQDTMAQLLASPDVKRAFFYNEEIEQMMERGVEDLVEGRGWFREDEYDGDL